MVDFPAFTPLRSLAAPPSSNNVLTNTIAYSYPQHNFEPIQTSVPGQGGQAGDSGSQDSPFDFLWKMRRQKELLGITYNSGGGKKQKDGEPAWVKTEAPGYSWKIYQPGSVGVPGYIPSLGLWYAYPAKLTEEGAAAIDFKHDYTYEAGTDCIGFAQRSASWMMKPGTYNSYVWHSLLPGMMEYGDDRQGTTNPALVYTSGAAEKRQYPIAERGSNLGADIIFKELPRATPEQKAAVKERLLRIVPGDIWVKDSPPELEDPDDDERDNHIAIVAYIPSDADEMDINELMNEIMLIEGEFSNKIQSVIKRLSMGDYDTGSIPQGLSIYDNFTTPSAGASISLNCQSWAIRRLK